MIFSSKLLRTNSWFFFSSNWLPVSLILKLLLPILSFLLLDKCYLICEQMGCLLIILSWILQTNGKMRTDRKIYFSSMVTCVGNKANTVYKLICVYTLTKRAHIDSAVLLDSLFAVIIDFWVFKKMKTSTQLWQSSITLLMLY